MICKPTYTYTCVYICIYIHTSTQSTGTSKTAIPAMASVPSKLVPGSPAILRFFFAGLMAPDLMHVLGVEVI